MCVWVCMYVCMWVNFFVYAQDFVLVPEDVPLLFSLQVYLENGYPYPGLVRSTPEYIFFSCTGSELVSDILSQLAQKLSFMPLYLYSLCGSAQV